MMMSLILLVPILASVTAAPFQETLDNRLSAQNEEPLPISSELEVQELDDKVISKQSTKHLEKPNSSTKNSRNPQTTSTLLSILAKNDVPNMKSDILEPGKHETKDKSMKKSRKHKAIFVDYPYVPQIHYPNLPSYDVPYNEDYDLGQEQRTSTGLKRFQESNIFYIRLPPTPYMFVPGLGYISQPPKYSTAGLLPQMSHVRPIKHQPVYQRPTNPFIKLPIDFVSNGKPTAVYQWQQKPNKRPTDSPITNLDSLSADFVSNGKPVTIYQWQTNLKPVQRPDDTVNTLDKGPYVFNGRPSSLYLLRPDGSSTVHQSIRYPDFQDNNSFY